MHRAPCSRPRSTQSCHFTVQIHPLVKPAGVFSGARNESALVFLQVFKKLEGDEYFRSLHFAAACVCVCEEEKAAVGGFWKSEGRSHMGKQVHTVSTYQTDDHLLFSTPAFLTVLMPFMSCPSSFLLYFYFAQELRNFKSYNKMNLGIILATFPEIGANLGAGHQWSHLKRVVQTASQTFPTTPPGNYLVALRSS